MMAISPSHPRSVSGSRINHVRVPVFVFAGLQYRKRCECIHMKIGKRIFHRFNVTHMSGEIENITLLSNDPPYQSQIRSIAFDDLDIFADGFDIKVVAAAGWVQGVEDRDRGAEFDEPYGKIAADKAQASGD